MANDLKKRAKPRVDGYCVRVSNITKGVHVKDFKNEVRKLANPSFFKWNGRMRSCMLRFNRKTVDNNEDGGIDNILKALEDLSIDIPTPDGAITLSKMGAKLLSNRDFLDSSDISRIESVDSTTV